MKKCPKCGSYMAFLIKYVAGNPVAIWECACGYDTSQESYVFSDRTEFKRGMKTHG